MGTEDNPIYGLCSPPSEKGRCISYYIGLKGERRLDVLIHEMLHACFWDIAEEGIQFGATSIAKALWRMGYRLSTDEEVPVVPPDVDYVTIRGRRYRFERVSTKEVWFHAGYHTWTSAPHEKNKFMRIKKGIKKETELQAILKSLITACYWDMDSESVRETAKDIGHALWRIGYRRRAKDIDSK